MLPRIFMIGIALCASMTAALEAASAADSAFTRYDGRHIRLKINVGNADDAKYYVTSFDQAVGQWLDHWSLDSSTIEDWTVDAVIMSDRNKATAAALIPDRVPDFKFGYAAGNTLLVIAQPSRYYTTHLLLHEGVHAFARHLFGGMGPPWFMEGTAEMLSTHIETENGVVINRIPPTKEASPYWGRVKAIADDRRDGRIPSLESIMRAPPRLDGDPLTYSWSWVAMMLFSAYPEYQEAIQQVTRFGYDGSPELTRVLYQRLLGDWNVVVARYRLLARSIDYGWDWDRERVAWSSSDPIWNGEPITFNVAADQGWQSAGYLFNAGADLTLQATGRITIDDEPKAWISEPQGVTIRYHEGQPLGKLVACVVPVEYERSEQLESLEIIPVGTSASIKIDEPSWIVFRVNEAPGKLANNDGEYAVMVRSSL